MSVGRTGLDYVQTSASSGTMSPNADFLALVRLPSTLFAEQR